MDQDLSDLTALAAVYGVATRYENSEQREVVVDDDVVVAVLAQFGVDASTPEAIRRELAAVRETRERTVLPPTLVLREGTGHDAGGPAVVHLEDGTRREVDRFIPGDLPLGWHRVVTADQDVVLAVVPDRLPDVPPAWGWMLQLYALRSAESWGAGDYGDLSVLARRSAEELGAGVLLVNPVQAISPTHPVERSPYSPSSRRFANPLYLRVTDTKAFAEADEQTRAQVRALQPGSGELIDYDAVWSAKLAALELLWPGETGELDPALDGFATFSALAEKHGPDWREWPEPLRDPSSPEVAKAREELADRIAFHGWLQHLCREQLDAARRAARDAGMSVGIVHDMPVGVHPGGADTWALGDAFAPRVTVGAPPDAFSQQGQDWNLPPWRPDRLAELGYAPFRDVLRGVLQYADGVRIDHVAGLWRLWWIPPGEPPSRGTYVHYDAEAMMGVLALEAQRAGAVVVGEDLGTVEPEVTETMHERGVLSSAVLWFQRDYDTPGHPFVPPGKWDPESMASITTHDLPTVAGWLAGEHVRVRAELGLLDGPVEREYETAGEERAALTEFLKQQGISDGDMVEALHTLLASAASRLLLTAPADVVGERRQPNLPGTVDQYPNWRIPLSVTVDEFFADPGVRRLVATLRAARPLHNR
ncbi:4-alpha-glucanotransferase [Amycolatopsis acidiphila]|uniref:4-alpha-glucanotransferase n=1 Tax=Amycolatopsis acidiphila TaxID=715473 RepID=A0A558AAF1_9PSEU|nr:4-alpha-glucanotransferase [Amycolatopsis acidiphila]TVT21250.1 4-alpha-glucanotransferase [Amycolatopsis acidiphila]UIJ61268.1 4-alpha-glucanotransferase [Amycolatopsis acidiphila]GHG78509.1 4-alpha-glucanotransferase [Amycolatopsis acidiphila]